MAFCRNCGSDIHDQAVICPNCGAQQKTSVTGTDNGSIGWALLGCCIPMVGLILFLVWKDTQPNNAKKAGMGALISVIASVAIYVVMFIIAAVLGTSGYYY